MANLSIESFKHKFSNLENLIPVSDLNYSDRYLRHTLFHLHYYCTIYHRLFRTVEKTAEKPAAELSLLDFGAGNGLLGLFAAHYGFRKVWICERDASFLQKAHTLSVRTNIPIAGFIEGDEHVLLNYFNANEDRPDIVIGADVIEHIYDLDSFFETFRKLNPRLIHVFTTGSNPSNYFKVRKLKKYQYQDEYIGHQASVSPHQVHNAEYALSFQEQRERIIAAYFSIQDNHLLKQLAIRTRGRKRDDIIAGVQNYLSSGVMPEVCPNPYWVCDPETGSWTERVLTRSQYKRVYARHGLILRFRNGFYNRRSGNYLRAVVVDLLNIICALPFLGKYLSPYIVLVGKGK